MSEFIKAKKASQKPVKPKRRHETAAHHDAFQQWYDAGRSFRKISQKIAVPERTLYDWARWFMWHQRADDMDAAAARLTEQKAVRAQAARLEAQRKAGTLLRSRGVQHFIETPVASTRDAILAIKTGIEIEQRADGIPDWVMRILNADDDELNQLEQTINSQISKGVD